MVESGELATDIAEQADARNDATMSAASVDVAASEAAIATETSTEFESEAGKKKKDNDEGLGAGAIAGIVIAGVVVVGAAILVVVKMKPKGADDDVIRGGTSNDFRRQSERPVSSPVGEDETGTEMRDNPTAEPDESERARLA